jgi:hypothetical protein
MNVVTYGIIVYFVEIPNRSQTKTERAPASRHYGVYVYGLYRALHMAIREASTMFNTCGHESSTVYWGSRWGLAWSGVKWPYMLTLAWKTLEIFSEKWEIAYNFTEKWEMDKHFIEKWTTILLRKKNWGTPSGPSLLYSTYISRFWYARCYVRRRTTCISKIALLVEEPLNGTSHERWKHFFYWSLFS